MQPTLLVNSETIEKAVDFNSLSSISSRTRRRLLPLTKALSWAGAFGSVFIFAQTYALSLQNIQINSALGEPLDAVVTVNAAPGEVLQASCMRTAANAESGMPAIRGVQLSLSRRLSPGTLKLTTGRPVNEPMSELVIHIDCPGAPAVKRSFLIMLDPRGVMAAKAPATPGIDTAINSIAAEQSPQRLNSETRQIRPLANESSNALISTTDSRIRVRSRQVTVFRGETIDRGSDYLVASGDALSTIAARIKDRDYGTVWSWAATIQAANPHAFINGNPNELIAGSALYIPPALAAGTSGLTVKAVQDSIRTTAQSQSPAQATPTAAPSNRYDDRFSTRTGETNANVSAESDERPAPPAPSEPAEIMNPRDAIAAGAIRAIQPVMVMATTFSGVSRERLRQRERGLIQAAPDNLPNFARSDTTESTAALPGDTQTPTGAPVPDENRTPLQPAVVTPERVASGESRFSWLGLLGSLGLALSAFFAGWWLSRRRAEADYQDQLEARINEERYRARVRTGRQDVIRAGMGSASAIEVTEGAGSSEEPEPQPAPVDTITEDDLDEVISATLAEEAISDEEADRNIAPPLTENEGPLIDPAELEVEVDATHELADIDLELLERDYAAQTETNTGLEEIAAAGRGKGVPVTESDLGMEFPEEAKLKQNSPMAFDTLEFDPREAEVDFDIGNEISENDPDKTDALGLDLEEAGASIDAHLEELKRAEEEHATGSLDATSEVEMQNLEHEIDDLIIDKLIDDDDTEGPALDPEEFYHLEASSIMNVGELDFEKGPDDETNILRFRQRNIRTGTDDSSGDEE